MEITINKASLEDMNTIQNLGRFYVYDMSRFCGFLSGWETPENGLFECIDLSRYKCKVNNRWTFSHLSKLNLSLVPSIRLG